MRKDYKYQLVTNGDVIKVEVSPVPDWDDFGEFVEVFIKQEDANLIAQDMGMDRHQIRYRKGQRQYILQFEHYTDSIWIETDY